MSYDGFEALAVEVDRGVAFVTIDHPPINHRECRSLSCQLLPIGEYKGKYCMILFY